MERNPLCYNLAMKLHTKLLLINLMLIILVIAAIVVSVVLVFVTTEDIRYNISHDTYLEVEAFMTEFAEDYKSVPQAERTSEFLKTKLDGYDAKLLNGTTGLKLYVARNDSPIYQGRTSAFERWFVKNRVKVDGEMDFSIYIVTMVVSQEIDGDDIILMHSLTTDNYAAVKRLGIMLLCCLVFIIGVVVIVYILEYVLLIPRMYKLKEALSAIYRGDYNYRVSIKQYGGKDIIGKLAVEFELMRRQLCELNKQKEAFDRQRGEVIAGISHDLKTPLTTIQGYSKGLVDGVAERMGKSKEYAMKIYKTAFTMNALVDRLRDFSKRDIDTIIYSFTTKDLNAVVKDFMQKYNIQYLGNGLTIHVKYCTENVLCHMDKEQFLRVFQNIFDNSVKYKDKPEANAYLSISTLEKDAIIIIKDDGPGVSEYELDYIFESYYRGDPSRTNPTSGSGLGLSVVKNIVNAHHGRVEAYNDGGLAIKITIPLRR